MLDGVEADRAELLIIDELGFVPLSKTGAELLFEVFSQRYERGSILVTSNLPFDEWTEIFGSERLTALTMVFKLCQSASKKWRRRDGSHQIAESFKASNSRTEKS